MTYLRVHISRASMSITILSQFSSFRRIFWLGLEKMHQLTSSSKWRLKVRVKWDKNLGGSADSRVGTYGESEWDDFKVGSEATNYQLGIGNQLRKNNFGVRDPFHSDDLNGMQFSTQDRDHDKGGDGYNCASIQHGGWWHRYCFQICLTCNRPSVAIFDGIQWRNPSLAEMWIKKV